MKLIKLEIKKNNFKQYLLGTVCIFIVLIAMGILFCAIPILEKNDPSAKLFENHNMIITMMSIISMSAFSIMISIMYSKIIIDEYTGKKNILLFTYPQKRSSIFLAKFILIFTYILISSILVTSLSIPIVGFIGNAIGLINEPFTNIDLIIKYSIIFALVTNFIGIISLRIGLNRKSIIVPIVTATILTSPFSNLVMLFKDNSIIAFIIAGLILFIISLIIFIKLITKVNKMECI